MFARMIAVTMFLAVALAQETSLRGSVEVEGDACKGQEGWQTDLASRMMKCGVEALASSTSAGSCMAKAQGVSEDCGACLGKLVACGGQQCIKQCCAGSCPDDEVCITCNKDNCREEFEGCAGVIPTYWE